MTLRRLVDVFGSGVLLFLTAPLFLMSALAIWLTDRDSVFYRQTRIGLLGRPFTLLKFRSMRINNLPIDDVTEIWEGHPLVTPVGKWIRRFKVDELPQLLNVLRGDMSLIGPRPPMPEHVEKYNALQRRRFNVLPGMTGWAQVNGGIELTWPERIMLDVWYVYHRSFWLDVRILWCTMAVILFGEERNLKVLQEAIVYANQEVGVTDLDMLPDAAHNALSGSRGGLRHRKVPLAGAANVGTTNDGRKVVTRCRIVHLTSVHPAFDGRIFHKECKSLAMAGYDVTLIAPRAEGDTSRDGVKIRAVTPPRNRVERMTRTVWNVYRAAVRANGEIYHFHDPELMPVGVLLKTRGKRVIYDVHEDFAHDITLKHWMPTLLRGPASAVVRACELTFTAVFDRVIAVTAVIARKFPADKARLVQNFPWTHEFRCANSLPYERHEAIAVYVGGLSDDRGLREMRQAVELAAKETPVRLVIAGQVSPGAKAEFERDRKSALIEHKGLLSRSQVAELLARARVGLVLNHPTMNYMSAQPHKLFEYMAAGLPVVASDFPPMRKIVGATGCGLLVDPLDPAAIAEVLVWLFRHPAQAAEMGQNGWRAVAERYNWERESECLIATYGELQAAQSG